MTTRPRFVSAATLLLSVLLVRVLTDGSSSGQSTQTPPSMPALPVPQRASNIPGATASEQEETKGQGITAYAGGPFFFINAGPLSYVVVMEPRTGRCWALYPAEPDPTKRWVYLGAPTKPD
jgi:hypothetical protein